MRNIKIYSPDARIPLAERIAFSDGTEVARIPEYKPGSIVPKMPWTPASPEQLSFLQQAAQLENADDAYLKTVSILPIPENLMRIFDEFDFKSAKTNEEARARILEHKDRMPEFDAQLMGFLNRLSPEGKKQMLGIFVLPPDQLSVANCKETNLLIGMHFDDAAGLKLGHRENKTNRISFNLGAEPRYLWFMDHDLGSILDEFAEDVPNMKELPELAHAFLKKHPEVPVIRVQVNPGEAYIAPTDYILHDGSTVGSGSNDITLVILGYFNPFLSPVPA